MQQEKYLIHEVAKEMNIEPHVLRYWEEELGLSVERNERGHRIYTREDVEKLTYIRYLKEQGLKLKAIKNWMYEERNDMSRNVVDREIVDRNNVGRNFANRNDAGKKIVDKSSVDKSSVDKSIINRNVIDRNVIENDEDNKNVIPIQVGYLDRKKDTQMIEIKERKMTSKEKENIATKMKESKEIQDNMSDKAYKMQLIMQKIFSNILMENNNCIISEITENIKSNIEKEFDYQMRVLLEEEDKREENRKEFQKDLVVQAMEKQEEHYKKVDELLREKMNKSEPQRKEIVRKEITRKEAVRKEPKWSHILSNNE